MYVCEHDYSGCFVGELDDILQWQADNGVPFIDCVYHKVGEEIEWEEILKEYNND